MEIKMKSWMKKTPWVWAFIGCFITWIAIGILTKQVGIEGLMVNASLASLLIIVSLGQMFAISSGEGGIDLSVPYVITLAAFLSFGIINGAEKNLPLAAIIVLGMGLLVGIFNASAILLFKIPPIISTMAVGFILNSVILNYSQSFRFSKTSRVLAYIVSGRVGPIPFVVIFVLVLAVIIGFLLTKLSFGRGLMAVGQNRRAAYFAGIRVNRTVLIAYMASGFLAALGGILIGARVNGAFLDLGQPYMLQSVGAVVLGGTLISGGKSTVIGTVFGGLLLLLIVTLMMVTKLPIGMQYIIQGLILIGVLAIGGSKKENA